MKKLITNLITTIEIDDRITSVGGKRSNWRVKVYPKPRIWVTKETLKCRNKKYGK